jgi:hypothetical protein
MTSRNPVASGMHHRFVTNYSLWGEKLNIDSLLANIRPRSEHEVWRRGDPTALGTPAVTSGLQIEVFGGSSVTALQAAVNRFLKHEARFLRAARSRTRSTDFSGLTTFISVGSSEEIPVGVELPPSLLTLVAKAGMAWIVTASVFADSAAPVVGAGGPKQ